MLQHTEIAGMPSREHEGKMGVSLVNRVMRGGIRRFGLLKRLLCR